MTPPLTHRHPEIAEPADHHPSDLSCTELPTTLEMAGFQVAFTNLCGYSADLTEIPEGSLPHALPDGKKFVGGVDIVLLQDNTSVNTLPAGSNATLSFDLPSGMIGDTLSILFWDPTSLAWVEKSLTVADGNVTLTVDQLGTFVVVEK